MIRYKLCIKDNILVLFDNVEVDSNNDVWIYHKGEIILHFPSGAYDIQYSLFVRLTNTIIFNLVEVEK